MLKGRETDPVKNGPIPSPVVKGEPSCRFTPRACHPSPRPQHRLSYQFLRETETGKARSYPFLVLGLDGTKATSSQGLKAIKNLILKPFWFPLQKPLSPSPPRPQPDPTQRTRNGPETDPKRTRNGAKRSQTDPKRTETEPKWTKIKLSGVGRPGSLSGWPGGGLQGPQAIKNLILKPLLNWTRSAFPLPI